MKKQYRDITVNGVKYAWAFDNRGRSDSYIRIWKDKKLLMENTIQYGWGTVSPKLVSDMILKYNSNLPKVVSNLTFSGVESTQITR